MQLIHLLLSDTFQGRCRHTSSCRSSIHCVLLQVAADLLTVLLYVQTKEPNSYHETEWDSGNSAQAVEFTASHTGDVSSW